MMRSSGTSLLSLTYGTYATRHISTCKSTIKTGLYLPPLIFENSPYKKHIYDCRVLRITDANDDIP